MEGASLGAMSARGCFVMTIRWSSVETEVAAVFGGERRGGAWESAMRSAGLGWRQHTNLRGLGYG